MKTVRTCRICGRNEEALLTDCPDCGNELPPVPPPKITVINRAVVIWGALIIGSVLLFTMFAKNKSHTVQNAQPLASNPQLKSTVTRPNQTPATVHAQEDKNTDVRKLSVLIAAAEKGDADAQCKLAGLYQHGTAVSQDMQEAIRWYRMAADQGTREAQYALGQIFESGNGVERNTAEAVRWYEMAVASGSADGRKALARLGR